MILLSVLKRNEAQRNAAVFCISFYMIKVLHTGPLKVNTLVVPLAENFVFVVDSACCHFSRDSNFLTDYLNQNKLVPVAAVLTHGHFDHVSGLKSLRASFSNLPVAIHKEDANLIGKNSGIEQEKGLCQMGFDVFLPFVSDLPDADCFLEDGKSLFDSLGDKISENFSDEKNKIGGESLKKILEKLSEWKILHTPGHTKGSCCFYNSAEKILISGDTMFFQSWGRTDLPGGDEREIHRSLEKILENVAGDTLVFSGHDKREFLLSENF